MGDTLIRALLTEWHWRPVVLVVLLTLGATYTFGWRHLRRVRRQRRRDAWRLASYLSGLIVIGVALLSPIDQFASLLFTAHMIQHMLLMMVAAPLLLLGNPLAAFLWGLPKKLRRAAGHLLIRSARFRKVLWTLTLMPVAWLLYTGTLWVWHHPVVYQAALRHHEIHDLEHLTFFVAALLFWWPIIEPAPRLHGLLHSAFGIVYLIAATAQNTLLGMLLALPDRVLYPYYAEAPRLFGLSALDDQALGGGIMWSMAHMYLLPILLLVARILNRQEQAAREVEAGNN
ncbi:MAG: cytochrome c oxidase assembly protein [Candidatus Rokuibacteriota bacterium]